MGKICDPQFFTGGQSPAIYYRASAKSTYGQNAGDGPSLRRNGVFSLLGPVSISVSSEKWNYGRGGTCHFIDFNGDKQLAACVYNDGFFNWDDIKVIRADGQADTGGNPPPTNCRCSQDSCRVDCAGAADGFCCIDNSFTDRLLQLIKN